MDFEVNEVVKKLKRFVCITCKRIMTDPVQSLCCGLRLCRSCAQENCPDCEQALEHFNDMAFLKECQILMTSCPLCDIWQGLIIHLQAHLDGRHGYRFDNIFRSYSLEPMMGDSIDSEDNSLLSYIHPNDIPLASGSTERAPFVTPSSVMIHQEDQDRVLCGSCGFFVMLLKLTEHRSTCYKLQKYNNICHLYMKPIFQEINSLIGVSEIVTGCTSSKRDFLEVPYAVKDTALNRTIQLQHSKMLEHVKSMYSPIDIPECGGTHWKISDISIRSKDVDNPRIRSSCFYSSYNGYCLRLGLHFGDKHDKLLVLLQDGKNDATLNFPFRGQVDIGILSFSSLDGIYQRFLTCDATQCFSEYGDSIAASLPIPRLNGSDFVCEDDVYINCVVQTEEQ